MARLFYGIIIPSKPFIDKVIEVKLNEAKYNINKNDNLYLKFFEYLRDEDREFDDEEWEEIEDDPYAYLIENYLGEIDLPDINRDFLDDNKHVFVGEDFQIYKENSLLSPNKQIPPNIKKRVKDNLLKYEFEDEPEVLLLGIKWDIVESTDFDKRKKERLP